MGFVRVTFERGVEAAGKIRASVRARANCLHDSSAAEALAKRMEDTSPRRRLTTLKQIQANGMRRYPDPGVVL